VIIVERPDAYKRNKYVKRKPYQLKKGRDWGTGTGGTVTVYDKKGNSILSLAEGEWTKVRRD
jgi:hypothetical protein